MKYLIFFSMLCTMSTRVVAKEATCDQLNERWNATYRVDFKFGWPTTKFDCPSEMAKLARAYDDLKNVPTGYDYYSWAKGLIRETVYRKDCADQYASLQRSTGKMTLCGLFFTTDAEGRVSTIVHEAAHALSADTGHVKCVRAKEPEKSSCDQTLHEGFKGSGYNFDFVYYRDALSKADSHWLKREVLKGWISYLVLNKFNEVSKEQVKKWTSEN